MPDIFHTAFRILFNIEIKLEGYSLDMNKQVVLIPDTDTLTLFESYRILSREHKNSFVYLIEVESEGGDKRKPLIFPDLIDTFRFQLKLKNEDFIDQTNLSAYDWTNHVARVSNETHNMAGTDLLLTIPVMDYNSTDEYKPGYIVKSGGEFLKAIQESGIGDSHGTDEQDYWLKIPELNGLNQADLISRDLLSQPADLNTIIVIELLASTPLNPLYEIFDASHNCNEVTYKINLYKQN